ncbi:hypothetical protein HN358_02495 [Candidatus Uhrbacteria bacterium]|jgi:hypothetical protein|nr:hypothetical protein [Candidatus Uhrbacteria bacterium]MBT7717549.1 hypothetical protein [Candidatus Uhrbacteria bacterium]
MGDQNTGGTSAELQHIEKEYKREVAITEARPLLHKIFFILWVVFDVALVGLLILVTVGYLISGQWKDRASTAGLVQNLSSIHSAAESQSASSIFVGETVVIGSGDGYDFYVELENSNEDWYASFDYAFEFGSEKTSQHHGFILPGESRVFVALNEEFEGGASGAEMIVSDIEWQRVDAHSVDDYSQWYADHIDFQIVDSEHGTVKVGSENIVRSSFTIKNNTPYSYWSAPFVLILERNGTPVGVNQISIAGFETGETREIDINWFDNTPSSGDLVIQPAIDYLDDDVYMQESVEAQVDVRDIEID